MSRKKVNEVVYGSELIKNTCSTERRDALRRVIEVKPLRKHVTGNSFEVLIFITCKFCKEKKEKLKDLNLINDESKRCRGV